MKFSLNVPTLERLIGGDTEVELELRQAAASEFAKRHLKNLINEEVLKEVESLKRDIHVTTQRVANEELKPLMERVQFTYDYKLTKEFSDKIKLQVQTEISRAINEAVTTAILDMNLVEVVKKQLDSQTVFYAKEAARNEVKKLLEIK